MTATGAKKRGLADVVASVKPLVRTTRICLDGELGAEFERLTFELEQALRRDEDSNDQHEAPALRKQLLDLTERMREAQETFAFQAIGRPAWRALVTECPPTPEQAKEGNDVDGEKFRPMAMAASCIEPADVTEELFQQLSVKLTQGQWDQIWFTCRAANMDAGDLGNLLAAFGTARRSETSS